jgi:predicted AAA+ superfamily ATPase
MQLLNPQQNGEQPLNFETIWRMFQETSEQMKETDRRMKDLQKTVGRVTNTLGDIVEGFMSSDIHILFKKYGYSFNITSQNKVFRDKNNVFLAEVDAFLENGDCVMLVEVKSKLRSEDITEQVERLKTVREIFDKRGDKRKLLGSIASPKISESQLAAIRKKGLYAIIPSEEDVKVYPEKTDFKAKKW